MEVTKVMAWLCTIQNPHEFLSCINSTNNEQIKVWKCVPVLKRLRLLTYFLWIITFNSHSLHYFSSHCFTWFWMATLYSVDVRNFSPLIIRVISLVHPGDTGDNKHNLRTALQGLNLHYSNCRSCNSSFCYWNCCYWCSRCYWSPFVFLP